MKELFDAEFYKMILDHIHSNVYITDAETDEIVYMNDFMKKAYNVSDPEGKICWEVLQSGKTGRCEFCKVDELKENPDSENALWKEESPVTGKTYINFDILQEQNGKQYHIQNSVDITEQVKLSVEATIDELTGLLNRQAGRKRLEDVLSAMAEGEKLVVALFDIDGLKWVNDTYGHLEGDRLLQYIATTMKQFLGEPHFIFRLSGDEFIVAFMNWELYEADTWMKKILRYLDENKESIGINYEVSFSYGLARVRGAERFTVSDILSIADTQMYVQKRDHHIKQAQHRLMAGDCANSERSNFKYNKEYLFEAFSESVDEYTFVGNLKTGRFMYSYKMMLDFGLPDQVLSDAAAFWGERVHPEDKMMFLRSNQEIADGKAERHTIAYRAKNAADKWVHLLCKGKMVRDEDGNPDLFAGVIRNLDRQKLRQEFTMDQQTLFYFTNDVSDGESTQIEESLLHFVNRNIPGGIIAVYDEPDYPILCFNQALLEYTGNTYEELMQRTGNKYNNLIFEEDRQWVHEELHRQLADDKETYEVHYRIVRSNGELMWVHDIGKYATNEDGQRFILSFFIDASEEQEREKQLQFINENSMDGVFSASMTDGFPVFYANDVYYRLHGYTRKQMKEELNDMAAPLVYEGDIDRINCEIGEILARKEKHASLEYRVKKRDGSLAWVHVDAGFRTMPDGSITMVGMIMDVTERRKIEDERIHIENLYNLVTAHTKLNIWEFDLDERSIKLTDPHDKKRTRVLEDVPYGIVESGRICENSIPTFISLHEKMLEGSAKETATIQVRKNNGDFKWEKVTYILLDEGNGKKLAVGISEDVTAQKEAEIRAFNQEKMSEILAKDSLFSLRINLTTDIVEDAWSDKSAEPETPLEQINYKEIYDKLYQVIANEDDRKRFKAQFSEEKIIEYIENKNVTKEFEYRQLLRDGRIIWVNLNMRLAVEPVSGERILFIHGRNIDAMKKRELALQKKAEIDEDSGLYNQGTVKLLIENILADRTQPLGNSALYLIDVDDFKEVNRVGGFLAGEEILRTMGGIIREQVSSKCVAGRFTGDVFVVFCYQIESERMVHDMIKEMQRLLNGTYVVERQDFELTVSIGAADASSGDASYSQLYQKAQFALDVAKRNGKSRIVFYDEIENIETNQEIQIKIDPETHDILSINENGMEAFGFNPSDPVNGKCYALLHGRETPCPFCSEMYMQRSTKEWECFVQTLNQLMYVREEAGMEGRKDIRSIILSANSRNVEKMDDEKEIFSLVEQAWSGAENGESEGAAYKLFLEYIGKTCNAKEVTLYTCKETTNRLERTASWNGYKETSVNRIVRNRINLLGEALKAGLPKSSMIIDGPNSPGYAELCEAYGVEDIDYPVILSGFSKEGKLRYCILVEDPEQDAKLLKIIEKVVERIRRLNYLYQVQKSYEHALRHDWKTELLNYESYVEYIAEMKQDTLTTLGMIGVRMVNLRAYNEKYGVARGDELLEFVAELVRKQFGKGHCFRMNRTTFFVLCEDISYEKFLEKNELLQEAMDEEYNGLIVTANAWEQYTIDANLMKSQVEEKLHVAQNLKKNIEEIGDAQAASKALQELKESIAKGRFHAYLQPKADAKTGKICGAEALVRYINPEAGMIPPVRFLAPLEKAGLIRYVDLFVLGEVCRIIKEWLEKGWKPFSISLNYSRMTILEPNILEETNRIVESYGIPKNLIEIEVTETIGSIDSASLRNIVDQFVEAGYRIALDDYGADYSNLYILYSLNIHTLKLDRKIINDIYHDLKARMVVENVIDICKKFNITCVAEGVEETENHEILKDMSCDLIQGYYINKPLPEEDFVAQYVKMGT